jgi:hypothetical protein
VQLKKFDARLCHFSRRDTTEDLWSLGAKSKLAYIIAYVSNGLPISPPLVKPLKEQELIFQGGHHRYAAAKAAGVETIPFYVEPCNRGAVGDIVSVQWHDT